METISWGIIGCGDVTELKSGPAFNKVRQSKLHAVMRRDIAKAADYAKRHHVPMFYGDPNELINDKYVNAIYIATPPDSHEPYALQAIEAGKPVYLEKPMTIDYPSALRLQQAVKENDAKLCVAHYRNVQPFFVSIKKIIEEKIIGDPKSVNLVFHRPLLNKADLMQTKAWRVNAAIAGGGLFHDLAPHQLATMLELFGAVKAVAGKSWSTASLYRADDQVEGEMEFQNGVVFKGRWDFNASDEQDQCIVTGSKGSIKFSFFGKQEWQLTNNGVISSRSFDTLQHVQQPMIEKVVAYFLGNADNPCPVEQGVEVMGLMQAMTTHR